MNTESYIPLVSVIMPVFNAEKYLREAIDSILAQTFTGFELVIINDGSLDTSEQIILSYSDKRIVYIKNEKNYGLIATLNNAVSRVKSKYIARMDSDDISEKNRLEVQLAYLENYPEAKMVCSPVVNMNEQGRLLGHWFADIHSKTQEEIIKTLPWENCIAHPTILVETDVLKKYRFSESQHASEDWDLWLRLVRDRIPIIKTSEVLLRYRLHNSSVTNMYNTSRSAQLKMAMVKLRFLLGSIKEFRVNLFVIKTFFTIYKDLGYYVKLRLPGWLRKLKWLLTINPFKARKQFKLLTKALDSHQSPNFLFFPYSHIGGAERVHAQVTKAIGDTQPFVFFTGLNNLVDYREQFGTGAVVLVISQALYHPFFSSACRRLLLLKINSSQKNIVFGCNNQFFYDLIPVIKPGIKVIDLVHDYNYINNEAAAQKKLAACLRCDTRVFISNDAVKRTKKFYDDNNVEEEYKDRIRLIYNYVDEPAAEVARNWKAPFRVLYVGRDTAEKRVGIIFAAAELAKKAGLPFEFAFVGEISRHNSSASLNNVIIEGVVLDREKLSGIYSRSHFIIITSSSEGFPLSLAEGMMHGCIPISTPVGDIPFHVKEGQNGFLTNSITEEQVINEVFMLFKHISGQRLDLDLMSRNARDYAKRTFDKNKFVAEYRRLFDLGG